jgi:predicted metal-dependent peptidase
MNAVMKQPAPVDIDRLRERLTKAHVKLMTHPETNRYGGVIVMGKSEIVDDVPTAATDGINKFYGADFCAGLADAELRFVIMHETLHVALRHILRHRDYWEEDAQCANMAADFVANALIINLNDKKLCVPPQIGVLYDPMFDGWSFGEVYRYLREEKEKRGGKQPTPPQGTGKQPTPPQGTGEQPTNTQRRGNSFDKHDVTKSQSMNAEQQKEAMQQVAQALEQGGLLASKFGQETPRAIADSLTPKIDWTDVLREFVTSQTSGRDDDVSLRRLDRRWLTVDMIMPTTVAETVGELVFTFDTSGSISDKQVAEGAAEISALVKTVQPERVRILWWDTMVHGEQVFTADQYDDIATLLKPKGGGGTRVSCVSKYISDNHIKADCVVVMTDGHVESTIEWHNMPPTLWIVTDRKDFKPPVGRVTFYHND